jgi:hypothetical protein
LKGGTGPDVQGIQSFLRIKSCKIVAESAILGRLKLEGKVFQVFQVFRVARKVAIFFLLTKSGPSVPLKKKDRAVFERIACFQESQGQN